MELLSEKKSELFKDEKIESELYRLMNFLFEITLEHRSKSNAERLWDLRTSDRWEAFISGASLPVNFEEIIPESKKTWEQRSIAASKKLSNMSEEERRMLLMWPEEKEFFLVYKKTHPENPWGYIKDFQKKIQEDYKTTNQI